MVQTEIQRHVVQSSPFWQFLAPIIIPAIFKTAENGARILIMGGLTTEEQHVSALQNACTESQQHRTPYMN